MFITIIVCLTIILIVSIICFTFYRMRNVEHTDEFLRVLENKVTNIEHYIKFIDIELSNIKLFMSKYESNLKEENKNECIIESNR